MALLQKHQSSDPPIFLDLYKCCSNHGSPPPPVPVNIWNRSTTNLCEHRVWLCCICMVEKHLLHFTHQIYSHVFVEDVYRDANQAQSSSEGLMVCVCVCECVWWEVDGSHCIVNYLWVVHSYIIYGYIVIVTIVYTFHTHAIKIYKYIYINEATFLICVSCEFCTYFGLVSCVLEREVKLRPTEV